MSTPQLEIQLIAIVVAIACALPGVFLVLRRMAMMSDAISHAILPGIVIAFFWTGDLGSLWLIFAAGVTGVLTVIAVELLERTRLVHEDAAIGLVFPILFSLGVILIAYYAGDVHLDTDAVLLGELAFAPFDRVIWNGFDLGPRALVVMGSILVVSILAIIFLYKELKLVTFDAGLATALGFSPALIHYGLMSLVSITAVGAFDAVGSILVVALMIAPPVTARLLTNKLSWMLYLSAFFGASSAVAGYWVSHFFDVSIAGSMATTAGFLFSIVLMVAPDRGLIAQFIRRRKQRGLFARKMLTIHIFQHENLPEADIECRPEHLQAELNWTAQFVQDVISSALKETLIFTENGLLKLTDKGREFAQESLVEIAPAGQTESRTAALSSAGAWGN